MSVLQGDFNLKFKLKNVSAFTWAVKINSKNASQVLCAD